ncbi:MAG: DMT family transporter [Gammaproteobacteria bacterium]|nr:DMT family transporter [Gammaproteobacteria bacterium]
MSVPLAFLGTILIWSTTPLGIKWSSEGLSFIFAVSSRMIIGTLGCLLLLAILRGKLPWHKRAIMVYVAEGIAIFGAMSCVYWGAQFIPSGLVSVIFGLTPLLTGLMASLWLGEQGLSPLKLFGMGLAFVGLVLIFGDGANASHEALMGMLVVFIAVILHSGSTVWIKKLGNDMPALSMTTGGLIVSLPFFLLSWFLLDGKLPETIPMKAGLSIVYLGLLGSVMGFVSFYYVLKHVEASKVGLIPLVTPVSALIIGALLNNEVIQHVVWTGTAMILSGMSIYQWGHRLLPQRKPQVAMQEE